MILSLPWLVIPIVLYNLIAFSSSWPTWDTATGAWVDPVTRQPAQMIFNQELFSFGMVSGETWVMTIGDAVIVVTLVVLFVELIKATRTGGNSIVDHALSMVLFMVCIIEFLVVRQAATSVFFIILVVTMIDVVAGFSITIRGARRDLGLGAPH
jgi:hypothetical protein